MHRIHEDMPKRKNKKSKKITAPQPVSVTRPKEDYKDKQVIIRSFISSQENKRKYDKYNGIKPGEAKQALRLSGQTLYQAYELGMKYHLHNRLSELIGIESETDELVRIRDGIGQNQYNPQIGINEKVDTHHLLDLMNKYANPLPTDTDIDFEIIMDNARYVYNGVKHNGIEVNLKKYNESYEEIRKFILIYVDPAAEIQEPTISEFLNIRKEFNDWHTDLHNNYCLIVDRMPGLTIEELKIIASLPWSIVFDFDPASERDGLVSAFSNYKGVQPYFFNYNKPDSTEFNPMAVLPYWYMLNGIEDLQDTLPKNYMDWFQKHGIHLPNSLQQYHSFFPKGLKILVLGGEPEKLSQLLMIIGAIYGDNYKVIFSAKGVKYEQIVNNSIYRIKGLPMSSEEFVSGIMQFATLIGVSQKSEGKMIPGKDGEVDVIVEDFTHFELLYLGIDDEDGKEAANRKPELFYKGERELSWYGAKNKFAIDRTNETRKLLSRIYSSVQDVPYDRIDLLHDPGAGGTTFARQLAFNLSNTYPVVIMKYYKENYTFRQIESLYRKVRMSIIIFVESTAVNGDTVNRFGAELQSHGIPNIIIYVKRISRKTSSPDEYLSLLTDNEFSQMIQKLSPFTTSSKISTLEGLRVNAAERYPFFLSLNVFEDDFKGIDEYVSKFIKNCDKGDKNTLTYIALVDKFADKKIPVSFFAKLDDDDNIGIFADSVNNALITIINTKDIKLRYPRFADAIIEYRITNGKQMENVDKANSLAFIIEQFIRYSHNNNLVSYDSTVELLKNLLILRDPNSMINSYFSAVITEIKEMLKDERGDNRYNCIGRIFKTLAEEYPNEPHFKAHLSRFYTNLERNYNEGISNAEEALAFSESKGERDPLLYHICGMSHFKYVEKKLIENARDAKRYGLDFERYINSIKEELNRASEMFLQVRNTNNKQAGYISDIEMCISVVDFGKEMSNCSTQEFILKHKDSWVMEYYDRAISLMEGYRSIQSDDDYYSLKLDDKYYSTITEMAYDISRTISMWTSYLEKANVPEKPRVRRFIARAKEKNYYSQNSQDELKSIMDLMEDNIKQEPENSANIRIWFNALRHYTRENSSLLLDEALTKLDKWKKLGDSTEADYYYFILICIKAIEGSSRAESQIRDLAQRLKDKTENMPNRNVIQEWYGIGKGIGRIFNAYTYGKNGRSRVTVDEVEKHGQYIEGRISRVISDRTAYIDAKGMDVFFTPSGPKGAKTTITSEDIGKRVRFIVGFSYDGVRALNRSVEIIKTNNQAEDDNSFLNRFVKCVVTRIDYQNRYLEVALFDEPSTIGRIDENELDKKPFSSFSLEQIVWGYVIGIDDTMNNKKLVLSLRNPEENMTDFQRKLLNLKI